MARLNLYIDTTSNQILAGFSAPFALNPATLPLWFGDTLSLQIYLLNTNSSVLAGFNSYTIINNAGLQLFVYLDDGTITPGVIYTQQINWTADPTNSFFYSTLSLNTMALQTLLGTATSAGATLKVGYVQGGLQTTVLSVPVSIGVGLPSTQLVVPAGLTPLSLEVANNLFVHLDGNPNNPGQGIYMYSPLGKKFLLHIIDNLDGTGSFVADAQN